MHVRDNDFAQAAVAGGGGHESAILRDVGHGHKLVERSSLGDEGNHFIDEAVEARDHPVAPGWRVIEKRSGLGDRAHDSLSSRITGGSSSSMPGNRPTSGSMKKLSAASSLAVETSLMMHSSLRG